MPAAITGAVAGVVGMVPEGLVLLTSIAFGVATIILARRKVLVQELPAVEGLARVDVVCLDKTGTLTEGSIVFDRVQPLGGHSEEEAASALGALAADDNRNGTLDALAAAFADPGWTRSGGVPFSSARKWSAAAFGDAGSWVIGAPEMVWADTRSPVRRVADELAATGSRTLLLARSDAPLDGETLPADLDAVALVLFAEQVRPDAAETLAYFRAQGVQLKVISGDNPRTVGAVARRVGLDAGEPFDARELPDDQDALAEVLEAHSVFGRVTPQQKRAMVGALQSRGHVVAMTGDGVNDALALKDADIGVAMGSGAAATRSVAQLVLLEGKFATLPGVVAEGRRVTANIERSANLFLTKTAYAALFSLATIVTAWPYPLLPRHLTAISWFAIGTPGFFLALGPNTRRYVPGFVGRVLRFAIPAGTLAAVAVYTAYALAQADDVSSTRGAHARVHGVARHRALRPRDPGPSVHEVPGDPRRRDDRRFRRRAADPGPPGPLRAEDPGRRPVGDRARLCDRRLRPHRDRDAPDPPDDAGRREHRRSRGLGDAACGTDTVGLTDFTRTRRGAPCGAPRARVRNRLVRRWPSLRTSPAPGRRTPRPRP